MTGIETTLSVGLGSVKQAVDDAAKEARIERERFMERLRGIKSIEIPLIQGKAVGGVLALGELAQCGPQGGYAWSVSALMVTGLTTGATPDVVNFFKNDFNTPLFWQLNGNSPGVTFGKLQRVLRSDDILLVQNSGTFASTANIVVSGTVIETISERLGELA
jgi:hypothetical protein